MIKPEWILHLLPSAKFSLTGEKYKGLVWHDDRPKPTEQDIIDAGVYLQSADYKKEKERDSISLTRRKFKLGIEFYPWGSGTLREAILSVIFSLKGKQKKKIQIEIDESNSFQRNDKAIKMMATAIGMTDTDVDDFFTWAENEEWENQP